MAVNRQLLQARRAVRTSVPKSVQAPIKGWNTRDPMEAMDPEHAITLDNWYPDFTGVITRNGYTPYIASLGSVPVQTLATFKYGFEDRFLAACGGTIWDISDPLIAGISLQGGFNSDIWQTAHFNNHLFFANGVDFVQSFDGSVVTTANFTGISTNSLKGVGVFHNRLFFWTATDTAFWYGEVNGIAGTLTQFDLGQVTIEGGKLVGVEVLSYDGGTGIEDYTCFFMSSGEVLLYSGSDPSNPSNWALVGRYLLGTPVATRAIVRYGGDIYFASVNDHPQISKLMIALKLGETLPRTLISGAAKDAYAQGKNLPGWQALYYPAGTRIIFNIPNPDGSFSQHILNTATQAWCRFTGQNAYHWTVFDDGLYFGGDNGTVYQADVGNNDNGSSILSTAQQAWQLFDTPLKKRVTAVRPAVQAPGIASLSFTLGYDYRPAQVSIPDATNSRGSLIFGFANWGAPSVWGGTGVNDPQWLIAGGEGAAIGMGLIANTEIGTTWTRTDFLLEPGNNL